MDRMCIQASEAEQAFKRQLDQARAVERNLQDELAGVRAAKEEAARAEEEAKRRVKELELALSQERSARPEAGGFAVPVRSLSTTLVPATGFTDSVNACQLSFEQSNLDSGLQNGQNVVEVDLLRQALSNAHLESDEQALQRQETAEVRPISSGSQVNVPFS